MSTKLPKNIRDMYADAYKLHETLYGMDNSPEAWAKCCELMSRTTIRHNEHPLMIALAVAVFDQLERDRSGT